MQFVSYKSARPSPAYYRLTGYLYPFRASESYINEATCERTRVLNRYFEGTSIEDAARVLNFDRAPRLLVLDGERGYH